MLSRLFDLAYHARNQKKTCHLKLDRDAIDGRVWSIEEFYDHSTPLFERPCDFFREGPDATDFAIRAGAKEGDQFAPDVVCDRYLFDTPYPSEWDANNLVPFRWFRNEPASRTILLFVPGWGRRNQGREERMCARLRRHGVDAGLLTTPFHQARTPVGSHSGEYFISSNLFWTIANFRQLVAEIRALVRYMRQHYDYVGLVGMSSGGFQAGLASNCEPVDFLFSWMSGCQLGSIVWHGLITQYIKTDLVNAGVTEEQLNKVWSITDQLNVGHACQARYRKHYITLHDNVIRPEYQLKLWDVYGRPDRREFATGHYSCYFYFDTIMDDIAAFVRRCTP